MVGGGATKNKGILLWSTFGLEIKYGLPTEIAGGDSTNEKKLKKDTMKLTNDSISDFIIKNKRNFGHWATTLEEWTLAIDRYCRVTEGTDNPYWYNERANIGILAGAAWRSGKIALEEFQTKKIEVTEDGTSEETPKKEKSGRCDLWICDDKKSEHIEAKLKWVNLLSENKRTFVEGCLDNAVSDACRISGIEELSGLGIAFIPVYVKATKVNEASPIEDAIHNSIFEFSKIKCDIIAWSFPHQFRSYVGERYGNHMPGVFMLIRRV